MKIQTSSATADPKAVLSNAMEDLIGETDHLTTQFEEALDKWKKENEDMLA